MTHIEMDADPAGHDTVVNVRTIVIQRHRVLNLMAHVDPAHRPDGDHLAVR